jgi:hypothetical protein
MRWQAKKLPNNSIELAILEIGVKRADRPLDRKPWRGVPPAKRRDLPSPSTTPITHCFFNGFQYAQ